MSTCETTTCSPCDQYDNCGCLNPNTFGCTTYSGTALTCLDVANGEDGDSILSKIEEKVCNIGKVIIDDTDTCPEGLIDKLEAGLNIVLTQVGTGCDRVIRIDATEGGVPVDVNAKVSVNDTATDYLYNKITTGTYLTKDITSPAGNEKLDLDVVPSTLLSTDANNPLYIGTDGGIMSTCILPDGSETSIVQGSGVTVSGTGTIVDPYIISTNPSIQIARTCFDNTWRDITLSASGNPNVVYVSGAPKYRYRFDGTIEFKGSVTYNVAFANNVSANRKYTIPCGSIPTTCLSAGEQAGSADLKSITYIQDAGQMYNYIIRKTTQNIFLEFQSSFIAATSKTIVVNFEGAISYPTI